MERCLACEAEGVATRGALPRLRGRRGRHPWSDASLARPKGSPPVERCLACEAGSPPVERCLACEAEGVATRASVASLARP